MIYIYLNTYPNGCLYVGSHKWDGEGIDPNYHGSSRVAMKYKWFPIKEEILEVVTEDRKLVAEREWIEKYATLYGIADCTYSIAKTSRMYCLPWINRYRRGGRLLNLHSNNAMQALGAHTRETYKKSALTNKNKGFTPIAALRSRTADSYRKSVESRARNGNAPDMVALNKASCSSEVRARRKVSVRSKALKVKVLEKGSEIFEGLYDEASVLVGRDESTLRKRLKKSRLGIIEINGYLVMDINKALQAIQDAASTEQYQGMDPIHIIDSVLHSGKITMGNQNDIINMFNRVAPGLSETERERIIEGLREKGIEDGAILKYKLSNDSEENFVYKVQIGKLTLTFIQ